MKQDMVNAEDKTPPTVGDLQAGRDSLQRSNADGAGAEEAAAEEVASSEAEESIESDTGGQIDCNSKSEE